jgi:hypothetical protein
MPSHGNNAFEMKVKGKNVLLFPLASAAESIAQPDPGLLYLRKQGTATQLIVDGKPFLVLAGELSNSSPTGVDYMERVWPTNTTSGAREKRPSTW